MVPSYDQKTEKLTIKTVTIDLLQCERIAKYIALHKGALAGDPTCGALLGKIWGPVGAVWGSFKLNFQDTYKTLSYINELQSATSRPLALLGRSWADLGRKRPHLGPILDLPWAIKSNF